jgi:DNA-binding NarL/FixJ family response regulator
LPATHENASRMIALSDERGYALTSGQAQTQTALQDCRGHVIRIDVLASSPIFLVGLVHTLTDAGIKVVAARTSLADEPSWLADAVLIDVDVLPSHTDLTPITEAARCTAVLVLHDAAPSEAATYFQAGASGVISRRESGEGIVKAVQAVTSGARVCPGELSEPPVAERTEAPGYHLSEREEQVLCQISRGLTHGQIATRLGISPHTVDTYVKRIRAKLGVGNKAELTRAALLAARQAGRRATGPPGPHLRVGGAFSRLNGAGCPAGAEDMTTALPRRPVTAAWSDRDRHCGRRAPSHERAGDRGRVH